MERRNTIQRDLVLSAVRELKNHATAEEIYAYISKTHPSISKGTVYRNLNILAEEKMINVVRLPEGADRYDHMTESHCHVRCIKCGKVFDLEMEPISGLENKIKNSNGVKIMDYNIIFSGICSNCQNESNKRR